MQLESNSVIEANTVCEFINDLFRKRGHFSQVVEVIREDNCYGTFWNVKEIKCEFPE